MTIIDNGARAAAQGMWNDGVARRATARSQESNSYQALKGQGRAASGKATGK
jgi:hypothetical protein